MFLFFQMLVLWLFVAWLISWIKPVWLRILLCIPAAFLLALEISAVYLTGQLADNRFFWHVGFEEITEFAFQFKTQMMLFWGAWIGLILSTFLFTHILQKFQIKVYFQAVLLSSLLVVMLLPNGVLRLVWQSIDIAQANNADLNQALENLGIHSGNYVKPHQVTAQAGKNIIVISLESFEQGFLQEPFDQFTPNLTALTKQWTYFDHMPPSKGSDWTAGSLYTLFTGLPAFFNQQHVNNNHLFQNSENFQLTTLKHVLQKAGYQSKYLIGKPDFAGISSILNTLGVEVISEQNSLGEYPESSPGLHDKDLFDEAELHIQIMNEQHKQNKQPFALFMSTINTHFPNGIMDERMRGLIPAQDNQFIFTLSATDYLLNDFMQFIQQQELLENTVVYVFPDHKMMGNTGEIHQALKQNPRMLYLLSSADKSTFTKTTAEPIYQTDLPQLILEGAKVNTNAKFFSELINTSLTKDYIDQNTLKLAALNNAALTRKQFNRGLVLRLADQQLSITSQDNKIAMPLTRSLNPTEVYQVIFNADMVPLEQDQISLNEAYANDHIDPKIKLIYLQTFIQNGEISKIILSNRQGIELTKTSADMSFTAMEITAKEITELMQQVDKQVANLEQQKTTPINQYATDTNRYIAHAGGAIDAYKYTNSLEALNHNYQLGFRLFELDIQQTSDGKFVATHDWPMWQKQTQYQGALPPSHEVYMQQTIHQKYTPLDMPAINQWFKSHSDATLVTDKVNLPDKFSTQFIDKGRLMMELFTWSAVKEANKLDLKAVIPTGDLLFKIPGDKIKYLNSLAIEYLAISRRWAESNQQLLRKLNQAGIKIFAFHVNFDAGKDETFVTCNERDLFYGLYADDWSFETPHNCQY